MNPVVLQFDVRDDGSSKLRTINTGLDEMKGKLDSTERTAPAFSRAMGYVKGALDAIHRVVFSLTGALAGLGAGLTAASFIKTASEMESLRVRMQLLTGSVQEGNRMFDLAAQYAERVTYEYLDIANAAVSIRSALNTGTDETMRLVQIAGDIAARAGMAIQDSAGQIVRMWAAGTGAADQFRERGVLAMLGFKAGVTYSVEETRKKLIDAWEDPERRIKGAAEGLGTTFKGILSMLSDEWTKFQLTLMEGGFFDAIKSSLEDMRQSFGSWLKENTETVRGWGSSLATGFKNLVGLTKALADNLWIVRDAAAAALIYMTGLATVSLAATISSVVALATKIGLMGAIFTTLGITVKGLVGFIVTSGVGAIIAGIAASAYYIVTHVEESTVAWGYFLREVKDLWSTMKEGVNTAGTYLGKLAADAQLVWERITGTIKALWNGFVMDMKTSFYSALEEVSGATQKLPGFMDAFKFKVAVPADVAGQDTKSELKQVTDNYLADKKASDEFFTNELKQIHAAGAAERTKNLLAAEQTAREVLGSADNPVVRAAGSQQQRQADDVKRAAADATAQLDSWKSQLAQIEAKLTEIETRHQIAGELDDRLVKLGDLYENVGRPLPQLNIEGQTVQPITEAEAIERAFAREKEMLDAKSDELSLQIQIAQQEESGAEQMREIAKLSSEQKAIDQQRFALPMAEAQEQYLAHQKEIVETAENLYRIEMRRLAALDRETERLREQNELRMIRVNASADLASSRASTIGLGETMIPLMTGATQLQQLGGEREVIQRTMQSEELALDAARQRWAVQIEGTKAYNDALDQVKSAEENLAKTQADLATNTANKKIAQERMAMDAVSGMLGNMAELVKTHGKAGFEAYKALSIAKTMIDTLEGAVAAYKALVGIPVVGPALGVAAATTFAAFGAAQVAAIQALQPPKMHTGGRVSRTGYDLQPDEVVRTLRVGERVLNKQEADDYERDRSSSRPSYQHETIIYNLIDQNMMLAPMAGEAGKSIIVNHIGRDYEENGPIRNVIKAG